MFRELFVVFQEYVVVFADMGHCKNWRQILSHLVFAVIRKFCFQNEI